VIAGVLCFAWFVQHEHRQGMPMRVAVTVEGLQAVHRLLITIDLGSATSAPTHQRSSPEVPTTNGPTMTKWSTQIDNHPIESLVGCTMIVQRNTLRIRRRTQDEHEG